MQPSSLLLLVVFRFLRTSYSLKIETSSNLYTISKNETEYLSFENDTAILATIYPDNENGKYTEFKFERNIGTKIIPELFSESLGIKCASLCSINPDCLTFVKIKVNKINWFRKVFNTDSL